MKLSKGFVGMQFRYKMLKLTKGAFLWVIWVRISDLRPVWIMVHQRNRRVRSFGMIRVRISDPRSLWVMVHQGIRQFLWCTMTQTDLWLLIRNRIIPKERTGRFLWCTNIQTDLGSLIRTRITPKERTLILFEHATYYYFCVLGSYKFT